MVKFVNEYDLNYDAIMQRIEKDGGYTLGDEDFDVFRCPTCRKIYLIDYEVEAIYFDPEDLSKMSTYSLFVCPKCSYDFRNKIILGEQADIMFRVTKMELENSKWK